MSEKVLITLITVGSALVTTLITTYRPRLMSWSRDRKLRGIVVGSWAASWRIGYAADGSGTVIKDVVKIEKVTEGKISGYGEGPDYGRYEISGSESRFALTLSYRGVAAKEELVGVAILKLGGASEELEGAWCEYWPDGKITGGTVTWRRMH